LAPSVTTSPSGSPKRTEEDEGEVALAKDMPEVRISPKGEAPGSPKVLGSPKSTDTTMSENLEMKPKSTVQGPDLSQLRETLRSAS
jgi:hypothetical protein